MSEYPFATIEDADRIEREKERMSRELRKDGLPVNSAYPMIVSRCDEKRPFAMPVRSYSGDAGYDLASAHSLTVHPGTFAQVPTNIRVALPMGTWAIIVSRSSTFFRRNLIVDLGIIDNGYTGELFGVVFNPTKNKVHIQVGDRLVQLVVFHLVTPVMELAEDLPERERGSKGFGSTGGI